MNYYNYYNLNLSAKNNCRYINKYNIFKFNKFLIISI